MPPQLVLFSMCPDGNRHGFANQLHSLALAIEKDILLKFDFHFQGNERISPIATKVAKRVRRRESTDRPMLCRDKRLCFPCSTVVKYLYLSSSLTNWTMSGHTLSTRFFTKNLLFFVHPYFSTAARVITYGKEIFTMLNIIIAIIILIIVCDRKAAV